MEIEILISYQYFNFHQCIFM